MSRESALVSIIIPSWNAAAYVKEAVDSALAQTYQNIEVILIDDGSTDNTKEALAPYWSNPKFRYLYQLNKGLASARNTGIRAAKGAYIAFLDSDDMFMPEKIEKQVAVLEAQPDFAVCYSDLYHFEDGNPRKFYHHRYAAIYPSGDIFEPLLHTQFLNPLTLVVRREVFVRHGMFDETLRRSEDWDLWLRWAHAGVKFFYLEEPLAYYRIRSIGNLSAIESEPEMKEKNEELFLRVAIMLDEKERARYGFADILRRLRLKTAFAYLMVGNKVRAREKLAGEGWFLSFFVQLVPAFVWKNALGLLRRVKHRLLLRRIKL